MSKQMNDDQKKLHDHLVEYVKKRLNTAAPDLHEERIQGAAEAIASNMMRDMEDKVDNTYFDED